MNYKVHVFKTNTSPLLQVAFASVIIGAILNMVEKVFVSIDADLGNGYAYPDVAVVFFFTNLMFWMKNSVLRMNYSDYLRIYSSETLLSALDWGLLAGPIKNHKRTNQIKLQHR